MEIRLHAWHCLEPERLCSRLASGAAAGLRTATATAHRRPAACAPPLAPRCLRPTGHTVYTLNGEGLIQQQEQQWSITPTEALVQSFTPTSASAGVRTPLR